MPHRSPAYDFKWNGAPKMECPRPCACEAGADVVAGELLLLPCMPGHLHVASGLGPLQAVVIHRWQLPQALRTNDMQVTGTPLMLYGRNEVGDRCL